MSVYVVELKGHKTKELFRIDEHTYNPDKHILRFLEAPHGALLPPPDQAVEATPAKAEEPVKAEEAAQAEGTNAGSSKAPKKTK